jgi:hypothetical protein
MGWAGAVSVAGDSNEIESSVELDLSCQVTEENGGAFEDAHQDHGFPREVARDLSAHGGHTMRDLLTRD